MQTKLKIHECYCILVQVRDLRATGQISIIIGTSFSILNIWKKSMMVWVWTELRENILTGLKLQSKHHFHVNITKLMSIFNAHLMEKFESCTKVNTNSFYIFSTFLEFGIRTDFHNKIYKAFIAMNFVLIN